MYIHIGQDISLLDRWIVGVFDVDKTTAHSSDMRDFLLRMEQANRLQWLGPEIPRSIIVTLDRVYLSPVSVESLRERVSVDFYHHRLDALGEAEGNLRKRKDNESKDE